MDSNDVKIPRAKESIIYNPKSANPIPNAGPVNKSLTKFIVRKVKLLNKRTKAKGKKNEKSKIDAKHNSYKSESVTIITCTNRSNYIKNIFENYNRQANINKELIIILNNDHLNLAHWQQKAKKYDNVRVFQLEQRFTLGKCLNFAVSISRYKTIAKFDDDDYYGPKYLLEAIDAFKNTGAKVLGKGATFVYFISQKILAIRTPSQENRYVNFVNGSTLIFKKEVFDRVKFANLNVAEDVKFCRDCMQKRFRIYSTSRFNHVYNRYPSKKNHTWKISDNDFLKRFCKVVDKTNDSTKYANQ